MLQYGKYNGNYYNLMHLFFVVAFTTLVSPEHLMLSDSQ